MTIPVPALLYLAASLAAAGCSKDAPSGGAVTAAQPLPITAETVVPRLVEEAAEYVGMLTSRRSVTLLPRVTGYVREILVKPGQVVAAGTRLLRIDARQEAAVLAQSSAGLEQARSQLELATNTRTRIEALYREGIRSRQDYDTALAQEQAARSNVQAARANVQAQKVQVAYHDVVAPFAGTVGDIVVKIGDAVGPDTTLTQVDQSGQLELSVQVPLERTPGVKVGQTPMELLDDEGKPTLRTTVFFVAPRPDPRTQLVELRGEVENLQHFRSGQRVRARVVWSSAEALTIPTFAVTRQTGQVFVFVIGKGPSGSDTVSRRPIDLGMISGDRWTVPSGLAAGDRIATSRLQALRDGQAVTVQDPKATAERGKREL